VRLLRCTCRRVVLAASLIVLGGCSSITDLVAPADVDPPAELQDITEQVTASTQWQYDIGVGTDEQQLNLVPAYAAERLFVADAAGKVSALDADAGKVIWSVDLDVQASGGPGLGEGLVLVGTSDAEVVALSADTGKENWRARVSSEVLAAPVAAMGRVIARTIDGKVFGLDAANGQQKWLYEREIPVLTLRGDSAPVVYRGSVLCGMAGGKLVALDIVTGNLLWEATVSVPTGRSELERLADIDGDPLLSGGVVYVATYQGNIAALDAASGSPLWRRKLSSYNGMSADRYNIYASDEEGVIWALDADNGTARWKQDALSNRQLSSVVVIGNVVAVGDFEGYVHFLWVEDGSLIGRTRVGSDPITRGMLVAGDKLFVQGNGGELEALGLANAR